MHALILAGGAGTRLRPLTDDRPKPLVPFCGEPFAAGLLRRLRAAGCERATLLVGADVAPFAPLRRHGAGLGMTVDVVAEERPLDTAGAARRALRPGAGRALVVNGDVLTDLDYAALVAAHDEAGAVATLALTRVADTSAYGIVVSDAEGWVRRFVEKPPPGTVDADTVNAGTYVLEDGAFARFPGDGPLSFEREVFPGLVGAGEPVLALADDAHWADLGTPRRYREGHAAVIGGRCAWPLGERMELRDGVLRHERAVVAPDARLEPPVTLGADVAVGAGARLSDAVVLDGARVEAGAVVTEAVLGAEAVVGAGARVADDAVVGHGAHVPPDGHVVEGDRHHAPK